MYKTCSTIYNQHCYEHEIRDHNNSYRPYFMPCHIGKPKLCHKKMSLVDSDITVTFTRTKDRRQAIQRENLTFTFQSGLDVNYSLLTFAVHILQ